MKQEAAWLNRIYCCVPEVSIVICTHNRFQSLDRCIELMRQAVSRYAGKAEIVVVHNGGSVDLGSIAQKHDARFMRLEHGNKCAAMNCAINQTDSEYLVFADDDTFVEEDWLTRMIEPLKDGGHASVGLIRVPNSLRTPWMTEYHLSTLGHNDSLRDGRGNVIGGAMAAHRRVFDIINGFDPELGPGGLGFGEDTLFSQQMKVAKMKVAFAMKAVADHCFDAGRLSREAFLNRAVASGRSIAYIRYHWEHNEKPLAHYQAMLDHLKPNINADAQITNSHPDSPALEHEIARHMLFGECQQMMLEKARPRNYTKYGFRKAVTNWRST